MNRTLAAAVLACCAGVALGQASLGTVAEVRGIVTVSDGATIGTAAPGTKLIEGLRFVSSSSGTAQLVLTNGCTINLEPNQSLVMRGDLACQELIASIRMVPGAPLPSSVTVAGAGPLVLLGPSGAIGGFGAGTVAMVGTDPTGRSGTIANPPVSSQ